MQASPLQASPHLQLELVPQQLFFPPQQLFLATVSEEPSSRQGHEAQVHSPLGHEHPELFLRACASLVSSATRKEEKENRTPRKRYRTRSQWPCCRCSPGRNGRQGWSGKRGGEVGALTWRSPPEQGVHSHLEIEPSAWATSGHPQAWGGEEVRCCDLREMRSRS